MTALYTKFQTQHKNNNNNNEKLVTYTVGQQYTNNNNVRLKTYVVGGVQLLTNLNTIILYYNVIIILNIHNSLCFMSKHTSNVHIYNNNRLLL